ncbi:periplasmic glucan biosynthesis protein MdoG [Methylobacterium sp. 4-46]|uniref:glucan biosynthesis protein G n=1 Tax=unclassified Methylobacterium TaxID=2615210 RepID=UPI000165C7BC|nr:MULTISPECIES: glucan biosynthesis protein G [Methylobacterium]ACA15009.1 periplasmic glucan biosynthesis protein MdoG [Methylobacterium sp. 4-46]WFT80749.1 glucan biosynthesis protein G [Methylobacterium nodulans]
MTIEPSREPSRRTLLAGLLAGAALPARAQVGRAQVGPTQPGPSALPSPPPAGPTPFRFDDVVRRARDLANAPFDGGVPALPGPLAGLDYDAWRDIRFRPDKALLGDRDGPFRLQLFHLGFLFKRPVTVNVVREGVPTPIPYQAALFDLGRTKLDGPLPLNLGFAGFRLHYPLNRPGILDELIAFLGASYFRFLGRDQLYGLSARGLAVNVEAQGGPEEFPFFREFWIEVPPKNADRAVIYGLLDGAACTGAYQFLVYPGDETVVDVRVSLHPRREVAGIGLAPLTSMFFIGENDRHRSDDYRPELHDSDGLLMQSGSGEWIWRPLRNPQERWISAFQDRDPKGFGLMQRDRVFENYQDLEAFYHRRPSYWVEPQGAWGEGAVHLVELPTGNETHDNVVAYWQPRQPLAAGQAVELSYLLRAIGESESLHPGARVVNTYVARPAASGGPAEAPDPLSRRFLIDFSGGDLAYWLGDPKAVEIVPSTTRGRIVATSLVPNLHVKGFRAALDVRLDDPGQATDLRAFLRAGGRTLSETWTFPWKAA